MSDLIQRLTADLQQKIETYQPELEVRDIGTVSEAGDGIARVKGLSKVRSQELVEFANGVMGIAFNLEERTGISLLDRARVTELLLASPFDPVDSKPEAGADGDQPHRDHGTGHHDLGQGEPGLPRAYLRSAERTHDMDLLRLGR